MPYRIGVDVGTTFTKLVAFDERTGHLFNYKTPTGSESPEKGFSECLHKFLADSKVHSHRIKSIIHTTSIPSDCLPQHMRLRELLREERAEAPLYFMKSDGNIILDEDPDPTLARTFESRSVSGLLAASFIAEQLAERNIISLDIGGTTTKIGLVRDGQIQLGAAITEYPVGGRSIVWLDESEQLRLGPQSTGARLPRTSHQEDALPTLTDAYVILHQLNSEYLQDAKLSFDPKKAHDALEPIAKRLNVSVTTAAERVVRSIDMLIGRLIRALTSERGFKPKKFLLVAHGGCGPMHASNVGRELGIKKILIPPAARSTSAFGLLSTDLNHESLQPYSKSLMEADLDALDMEFRRMERQARALISEAGVEEEDIIQLRFFSMRHPGDTQETEVSLGNGEIRPDTLVSSLESFQEHNRHATEEPDSTSNVEIVNLKVKSIGILPRPNFPRKPGESSGLSSTLRELRDVVFAGGLMRGCPIYNRSVLAPGTRIKGPAIVEDSDSTTILQLNDRCVVDEHLNLIINIT